MNVRPIKSFLPAGSPASAVYAALDSSLDATAEAQEQPPFRKVLDPVGHRSARRPRQLSVKQARTFLGEAAKRIKAEALDRSGKYLRSLDTVHLSGNRTRAERWLALAAIAEPLLARLDIATGCLGYLNEQGQFRLNRQNGMAEDAGISPTRLCRLLKALEAAKYTLRKIKRIYRNGKRWICRITIYIRPRFFIDLGLGFQHAAARTSKAKAFLKKRRQAQAVQQTAHLDEVAAAHERRMSHRKAEGARAAREVDAQNTQKMYSKLARNAEFSRLVSANPDMGASEIRAILDKTHPPE
ncbi:hypothetical protein [Pseudomonas sp. PS01297]|uniref:hypothetical protein n=1 Tax=Pseudomonas sp. PS01297 TaxID=2991433 RepID=UPI00249B9A6A|nr:hypothetical protein [Pseudomonas sp. PS01297]